jgi:hypothetical protein
MDWALALAIAWAVLALPAGILIGLSLRRADSTSRKSPASQISPRRSEGAPGAPTSNREAGSPPSAENAGLHGFPELH